MKAALDELPGLRIEEIEDGSNVFKLHVEAGDPSGLRSGLRERGLLLPGPNPNFRGFALAVNETWVRRPAEEIVGAFREVLGG